MPLILIGALVRARLVVKRAERECDLELQREVPRVAPAQHSEPGVDARTKVVEQVVAVRAFPAQRFAVEANDSPFDVSTFPLRGMLDSLSGLGKVAMKAPPLTPSGDRPLTPRPSSVRLSRSYFSMVASRTGCRGKELTVDQLHQEAVDVIRYPRTRLVFRADAAPSVTSSIVGGDALCDGH